MSVTYKCESCGKECGDTDYFPSVTLGFYTEPLRSENIHALFRAQAILYESRTVKNPRTGEYINGAVKTLVDPVAASIWRWSEIGYCSECVEELRLMYLKYMGNMLSAFKKKIEKRSGDAKNEEH